MRNPPQFEGDTGLGGAIRLYAPEQPRDDHGRWTDGGPEARAHTNADKKRSDRNLQTHLEHEHNIPTRSRGPGGSVQKYDNSRATNELLHREAHGVSDWTRPGTGWALKGTGEPHTHSEEVHYRNKREIAKHLKQEHGITTTTDNTLFGMHTAHEKEHGHTSHRVPPNPLKGGR